MFTSGAMTNPTATATRASAQQPRRRCPDDEDSTAPARRGSSSSSSTQSEPDRDHFDPAEHDQDPLSRGSGYRRIHISSDYVIRDVADENYNQQSGELRPKRRARRKAIPASLRRDASTRERISLRGMSADEGDKDDSHTKTTDSAFYGGWQDLSRRLSHEAPLPLPPCILNRKVDESKSKEFFNRIGIKDDKLGQTCHSETERTATLTPSNSQKWSRDSDDNRNSLIMDDSISSEDSLQYAASRHNSAWVGSRDSVPNATGSYHSSTVENDNSNDEMFIFIEDFQFNTNRNSSGESGNTELTNQLKNARRRQYHQNISMTNILVGSYRSEEDLRCGRDGGRPILEDYIALKLSMAELRSELEVAHDHLRKCTAAMTRSGGSMKQLKDEQYKLRHHIDILQKRNAELEENNLFFLNVLADLERRDRLEGVADVEFREELARAKAAADTARGVRCAAAEGEDREPEARVRGSPLLEDVRPSSTRGPLGGGAKSHPYHKRPSVGTTDTAMSSDVAHHQPSLHSTTSTLVETIWSIPRVISTLMQPSAREGSGTVGRGEEHPGSGGLWRHPKRPQEPQRIPAPEREETQDDEGFSSMLPVAFVKFRDTDMKSSICSDLSEDASALRFAPWWNKRSSPKPHTIKRGDATDSPVITDIEEQQVHPHGRDGALEPKRCYLGIL